MKKLSSIFFSLSVTTTILFSQTFAEANQIQTSQQASNNFSNLTYQANQSNVFNQLAAEMIQNPSLIENKLMSVLHINTIYLKTGFLHNLAYEKNQQALSTELEYLSANANLINSGEFTDYRYVANPTVDTKNSFGLFKSPIFYLSVAAIGGGAAALAANGGGSASDVVPPFFAPDTPTTPTGSFTDPRAEDELDDLEDVEDIIADNEFQEFGNEYHTYNIAELHGVQYAYAKGLSGNGVDVGILDFFDDTAIASDTELPLSRITYSDLTAGGDEAGNCPAPCDHGNTVAHYALADKNDEGYYGIAYDANIMLQSYGDSAAPGITNLVDAGADVINMSFGTSEDLDAELDYAAENDVVVVVAAGNSGPNAPDPSYPGDYAGDIAIKNMLVVVATQESGEIQGYSNRCGSAKLYCVAAKSEAGTSFSAPVVTGVVALLREGWSYLTAEEIVQIILRSADERGEDGVDEIYGWGEMDVERAMAPIAEVTASTSLGNRLINSQSKFNQNTASNAFGDLGTLASNYLTIYDSFDRDFSASMASFINKAPQHIANASFYRAQNFASETFGHNNHVEKKISSEKTLSFSSSELGDFYDSSSKFNSSMKYEKLDDYALGFSYNKNSLGDFADSYYANMVDVNDFAVPYLSSAISTFDSSSFLSNFDYEISNNLTLSSGFANSRDNYSSNDVMLFQQGLNFAATNSLKLDFGFGYVAEDNSIMGASGTGLFDFADSAQTKYINAGLDFAPTANTNLFASTYFGFTNVDENQASIAKNFSTIKSEYYSAGFSTSNIAKDSDNFTFAIVRPLKVTSASLTTADNQQLSLSPDASQTDYNLSYSSNIDEKLLYSVSGKYSDNYMHSNKTEDNMTILSKLGFKLN